jgi:hypothetical protein
MPSKSAEPEKAEKGKQAATEDYQSQSDDFVMSKKDAADEIRRKKAEADNKRNVGATKKLELKKKAGADKKAEEKEKKIIAEIQKRLDANIAALQKEPSASKINKQVEMQLSKAYAKKRAEYEKKLDFLRQEANAVLESVEAPLQAATPSSADDVEFPPESQDDIANLTPPIRLSQDEVSEGLVDYGKVQRLIFKRLGDRVMRRPAEFVSPFQIKRKRPDIPVSKAVYLRQKIISEPELQQYVSFFSFFTVYFFMLQLFSYWHCNCYTPSFAICTLFLQSHIQHFFFATTHTAICNHMFCQI